MVETKGASPNRSRAGGQTVKQINWQDLSVSDVVLAAILAAVNLDVDGFAREFKGILQKPKSEWFNDAPADRDSALAAIALEGRP